jgi:heme/copper-type cytochrome/quinol oxidase subunit 3
MTSERVTIDAGDAGAGVGVSGHAGAGKLGMWIFLVADAISFASLLTAAAVLRVRAATWPEAARRFDVPLAAGLTYVLLGSSLTMALAVDAAQAGRARAAQRRLWMTLMLGAAFVAGQAIEWSRLGRHGVTVAGDAQASSFFVCTGWHGAHVLAGVITLAVLGVTRASASKLAVAALFWHFLDAMWILIFTLVYLT